MPAFLSLFADHGDPFMPYPANAPTADDLAELDVYEVAALPVEMLALLQHELDDRLMRAKDAKARLDGALVMRFGARAAEARRAQGKDTGTVRFDEGDFTVVADLPKRVDWDQDRLAAMVERIRAAGDDPAQYVEVTIKVPERKYAAWPDGDPGRVRARAYRAHRNAQGRASPAGGGAVNAPALSVGAASDLPSLIDRAASMLFGAKTAAEVLEAREAAGLAYDVAKRTARLQRAKSAHDDLVAAAHRAQAHALEIEARAKRRLADEYDAAQARGEVASHGGGRNFKVADANVEPTAADLGLRRDEIDDARLIRDAELAAPGIVRRSLDERLDAGEEPTRAALRKMVVDAAMRGLRPPRSSGRRNPLYLPPTPEQAAWRHVTGTFRAFAEWASDENLDLAHRGMTEAAQEPFHHLDAKAIAEGSAAFTKIREWFDAG